MRIQRPELLAPPNPERPYRSLEMVRRRGREQRYSEQTIGAYVYCIRRFVLHFKLRHPRELGPDAVRAFLHSLATDAGVAASNWMVYRALPRC